MSPPSCLIFKTEIWLLPASTAIRYRPSLLNWSAPCDARPLPVPAPPAANGDPGTGESEPSALRSNAAIVFVPAVLSLGNREANQDRRQGGDEYALIHAYPSEG